MGPAGARAAAIVRRADSRTRRVVAPPVERVEPPRLREPCAHPGDAGARSTRGGPRRPEWGGRVACGRVRYAVATARRREARVPSTEGTAPPAKRDTIEREARTRNADATILRGHAGTHERERCTRYAEAYSPSWRRTPLSGKRMAFAWKHASLSQTRARMSGTRTPISLTRARGRRMGTRVRGMGTRVLAFIGPIRASAGWALASVKRVVASAGWVLASVATPGDGCHRGAR